MTPPGERTVVGFGVGFAALLVAVVAAYTSPATAYELSIYSATPVVYWVGLGTALGVALLGTLYGAGDRWTIGGSFLLAYASLLSFVALPIIRGYHYKGAGDSLTHLGWVRDVAGGMLDPLDLLYPAVHVTSYLSGRLLGVEFTASIQLVVLVYFALFLLSVPLCVYAITDSGRAACLGLFAAGLFLPINLISLFRMAHPFGQGVLFLPFVLYLLFTYVVAGTGQFGPVEGGTGIRVATGAVLVFASIALVLVHPQLGVGLVGMFVVLAGLQRWIRSRHPSHAIAAHSSLTPPAAIIGAFYAVWILDKPAVREAMEGVVASLLAGLLVGQQASQQAGSAEAVGLSPEVLAFRLFFVSLVFCALAGGLMVLAVTGRLDGDPDGDAFVVYLTVGSAPLFCLWGVFLISDLAEYDFRYLGAIMAVVTVLGTVALVKGVVAVRWHLPRVPVRTVLAVTFAVLLPLSMLTVYFSPYVLRGSGHVTEQRLAGYESAFEHREPGVAYVGIRTGPDREAHAVRGTEVAEDGDLLHESDGIPPPVFDTNLSVHYGEDRYVTIRDSSHEIEVGLYDGLRYSEEGFQRLDTTPGINRVQSNGEFRLYRVNDTTE